MSESSMKRKRTIRWPVSTDEKAEFLAFEEHRKGGVSELLTVLVDAKWSQKYSDQLPSDLGSTWNKPRAVRIK
jgi:hypothetical protein